ncbi:hypothetical protein I546_3187 [Mycobacterium kansasii 732]|nr:hypothetical protein I546_3187 [Mycobacterium kansasii 732]
MIVRQNNEARRGRDASARPLADRVRPRAASVPNRGAA